MLHIQRVLFPTDRSPEAEQAYPHAVHLAAVHGAELHALHVSEESASDRPDLLPMGTADIYGELHLAEEQQTAALPPERIVQREIRGDDAADEILSYAEREGIDLIVMGTHGRGGVERLLMGSVAERVVREAPCPVLTVRASAGTRVERILVPVDFSDRSKAVIPVAQELAVLYGAATELVYVIDAEDLPLTGAPLLGPVHVAPEEVEKRIGKLMSDLVKEYRGEIPTEGTVLKGDPARAVLDHAAEHADLIVMATHGRTGMRRLLMGSVAENIVRRAEVPVFTVKSFGRDPRKN